MPPPAPRTLIARLLSPTGFVLTLILFGFPFLAASCEAPQGDFEFSATFTGVDLLVGGKPDLVASVDEPGAEQFDLPLPVQPLAIVAVVAILAAAASALLRQRLLRHAAGLGLAVLAVGTLAAAEMRALGDLIDEYGPLVADVVDAEVPASEYIHTQWGFWVAFYALTAMAMAHAVALLLAWRRSPGDAEGEEALDPEIEGSERILSLFDGDDRPREVT
jgi:hypothetical protein